MAVKRIRSSKGTNAGTHLPGSWKFLLPSMQLVRQNFDTLLWLLILPSVINLLANQLIARYIQNFAESLGDHPTNHQITIAFHGLTHDLSKTAGGQTALVLMAISAIWTFLAFPALVVCMTRVVNGKDADVFSCLRDGLYKFWRIYGAVLMFFVLLVGGLVLFILPGLFVLRRYLLAPLYLADQDVTIRQAFILSGRESAPFAPYIWGLIGVEIAIAFISSSSAAIPLIGSLLSLAVTYSYFFGPALRYKSITEAAAGPLQASKE
jgi:hypothetical protein